MPKNIHQITRQRIHSADFAQKPGLVQRISSMLKKVWGRVIMPNQINTECQSKERIQAWIDAMADEKRYCFYIAVGLEDSDITYPLGNWNIPFYFFKEADQFKNAAQLKYPDCSFDFIIGTLHIDQAMEAVSCVFWAKWQKKHNERISLLDNKKAVSL